MSHNIDQENLKKILDFLHRESLMRPIEFIGITEISNQIELPINEVIMIGNYCRGKDWIESVYAGELLAGARITRAGERKLEYLTRPATEVIDEKSVSQKQLKFSIIKKKNLVIFIGVIAVIIALAQLYYQIHPVNNGDVKSDIININNSSNVNVIKNSNNVQIITNYGALTLQNDALNSELLSDGEHGRTFTNKLAGFTIQKPDENWYFTKNEKTVEQDSTYLGGIAVQTDRPSSVSVAVEKLVPENSDLSKFVDNEISLANKMMPDANSTLAGKFVSSDGNWASFDGYTKSSLVTTYQRQILHKYHDKLYMIDTATVTDAKFLTEEMTQKLNQIVESFRTLD